MLNILKQQELKKLLQDHQDKGLDIVFTNGCFDILHVGHVRYLRAAREQGDILVVAVNSDASVKRLKGDSRPLNNENDRAEVIAALGCVDYVTIFGEDTASSVLRSLAPDIYVKGGDYSLDQLPEKDAIRDLDLQVVFVPFEAGYSTTRLVDAIKGPGA